MIHGIADIKCQYIFGRRRNKNAELLQSISANVSTTDAAADATTATASTTSATTTTTNRSPTRHHRRHDLPTLRKGNDRQGKNRLRMLRMERGLPAPPADRSGRERTKHGRTTEPIEEAQTIKKGNRNDSPSSYPHGK